MCRSGVLYYHVVVRREFVHTASRTTDPDNHNHDDLGQQQQHAALEGQELAKSLVRVGWAGLSIA